MLSSNRLNAIKNNISNVPNYELDETGIYPEEVLELVNAVEKMREALEKAYCNCMVIVGTCYKCKTLAELFTDEPGTSPDTDTSKDGG